MCQRDACVGGNSQRGTNTRHYFEWDAAGSQRLGFFRPATKQERIAALESHDSCSRLRVFDQQIVDLILRSLPAATDFADVNTLRMERNVGKYFRIDKIVVNHDVTRCQKIARLDRK